MLKICSENKTDTLFVSFAGHGRGMGKLPQFEFQNFLKKNFDCDFVFYLDKTNTWYHQGIEDLTKNISETTNYLERLIKHYKNVYFIGSSAGGYAAILFGTLVYKRIKVIAFEPQTILPKKMNLGYDNLKSILKESDTTFHLFADSKTTDSYHSISHCYNLSEFENVTVYPRDSLNLKEMRNSGELLEIFNNVINFCNYRFLKKLDVRKKEFVNYQERYSIYECVYCHKRVGGCKCVFNSEFLENLDLKHITFLIDFIRTKRYISIETKIGSFKFYPPIIDKNKNYMMFGHLVLNFNNDFDLIGFNFQDFKYPENFTEEIHINDLIYWMEFPKKFHFIFLDFSYFFNIIVKNQFDDKIKIDNFSVFHYPKKMPCIIG